MSDYVHAINQHYGQAELCAKILAALRAAGKDPDALTRDDLASFDELHDGGREGTRELARLARLRAGMQVDAAVKWVLLGVESHEVSSSYE